ncbi:gametogenetin-binding protein 2 isoform X1 [Gadus chalcogrammus]|uniref:gametogenetin-binding protein 2 isoform X1 n=1 Tax=Gadus chalcogrammus TaxID=1042646 RepID=UPI0024C4CFE2|nr:gametogenetin-binding protein 2 isoform X1 [Gadus chalcogrammus]XP_056451311.1 gametogenetin-binding protein 2 isoform X1 [Gadus chalcogrammus]
MARLVAICREGEEDFPFLARQIPLYIDEPLTMVMEFPEDVMDLDSQYINTTRWIQFAEYHSKLKQQDLHTAMMVTSREVFSTLAQLVPCVGCRRSVERLFSQLVESGNPALEPLTVKTPATLSVTKACLADAKKLFTLFYVHGSKLNDMIDAIPKSKKNKRCQLHSLDTHKPKPLGGSWMDVWERMSQGCRDEVVLIDSACLLETLETYLRKHRFCTDCKNKVLRAYNILAGELDCTKEKGYCAALYEGLCCCPHERHIHVCCETDFIAHLLGRAEPEFSGGYERRERHAKTMDVAQEEVLTCLGIHLYERLHRIWQKLRAEEQTWQMLFYLGVDALRRNFEMAVEKMQGISRLEQFVEELSEEERAKELKQEKKRQKRKNRRKNKCGFDVPADKEKSLDECSLESVDVSCKACGSPDEEEEDDDDEEETVAAEVIVGSGSDACTCPESRTLDSPQTNKGLSPHSNASDCGYSSSMEGSETGSRGGSDVACTEVFNHDDAGQRRGDFPNGLDNHHLCSEAKEVEEEEAADSCVECWSNAEDNTKCKNKKKKRKGKSLCNDQGQKAKDCSADENKTGKGGVTTSQNCQTKETRPPAPGGGFASIALPALCGQPDNSTKSLVELLGDADRCSDEDNCLTPEEIRAFVESNKSFYSQRDRYRQHLRDTFTNYCRATQPSKPLRAESG